MWHHNEHGAYGFEVLRPDEDGEMEIVQVSLTFQEDGVVIQGPENTFTVFEGMGHPYRVAFQDEYLIGYFDGHFMEFKIEAPEGLVCDHYDEEDGPIDTTAIWWEDL